METGSFRNVVCCATEKFPIIINKYTWNHCQKFILSTEVVYMHRRMAENGVSKHFLPNFFFFHWHYSPLWALACRTISFHFILSATKSLHLLTNSTWRSLSTSSLHLFLGLPLLLVPSSSWVKIFLDILSSSILSRWPNQLILCPFIHFTIFSPLVMSSSSRFVRLFHSPFSYLRPYILLNIFLSKISRAFYGTRTNRNTKIKLKKKKFILPIHGSYLNCHPKCGYRSSSSWPPWRARAHTHTHTHTHKLSHDKTTKKKPHTRFWYQPLQGS